LPPVESLTIDSDFSAFLQPEVDETLKRQALKQLFRDPHFNVMDGLDVYIDDYSNPIRSTRHRSPDGAGPLYLRSAATRINAQGHVGGRAGRRARLPPPSRPGGRGPRREEPRRRTRCTRSTEPGRSAPQSPDGFAKRRRRSVRRPNIDPDERPRP
jgi:hypothetical protein